MIAVSPLEDDQVGAALVAAIRSWLDEHRADALAMTKSASGARLKDRIETFRPMQLSLYDAGLSRYGWPEPLGGLGGSPQLRGVLYDELYGAGISAPPAFELLEVIMPTLVHYSPALASQALTPFLRGEKSACQGFSEPDAGSDLASLRTKAEPAEGGYLVTGQKVWSTHGHVAHWCILLARTGSADSRHRGLTMFWVDLDTPGITVRPIECADGRDELTEIFFDEVFVPAERVIGQVGGGWDVAMYLLQFERGNYAWQRQAGMRATLARALTAAGSGSDPGRVGEAILATSALRARTRGTVVRLANDERLGPEASVDKLLLSAAERATQEAVRSLTWPSFDLDADPALQGEWLYGRVASIYGGAAEIQRDIVADHLLGLGRRS